MYVKYLFTKDVGKILLQKHLEKGSFVCSGI